MKFFRQLKESVTDFKFYNEIKNNTFGKSFVYFLILFFILYSINTVENYAIVNRVIDVTAMEVSDKIPNFYLENGKFVFEGEMPFYIIDEADQTIVIDTTGQLTEAVLENIEIGALITGDKAYVKNTLRYMVYDFKDYEGVTLTKQGILDFLPRIPKLIAVFLVIGFIFVLGYKLLNVILLAVAGLLISSILKAKFNFNNLLNFAIYALTLPMLLQTAIDLSGIVFPNFWLVYWLVSVIYMAMAIRSSNSGINVLTDITDIVITDTNRAVDDENDTSFNNDGENNDTENDEKKLS